MSNEHLIDMSQRNDDEKQEIIAKAQQARKLEKKRLQKYADEHYRIYEDEKEWAAMAKEFGVRLPRFIDQPTKKNIRKFAKKIGKDVPWVKECWGVDNFEEIAKMNPDMSMRYVAGCILEDLKGEEEMWITVDVEIEELAQEFASKSSQDYTKEFIKALDLAIADSEFTEGLIKDLINSMKHDFNSDESLNKMNEAIKLLDEAFGV